jgi:hypothetical protein
MRYNVDGSAAMTGKSLVPVRDVTGRRVASPVHSMVRESSVTLVSGASRIPFERSNRTKVLARSRNRRDKASAKDVIGALTGNWREEHLFVLGQALAVFDSLAQRILECDAKIEALLAPLDRHEVELSGPDKRRQKNTPQIDARAALARRAGVDLTRINGLSVATVMSILSEIGPDLSRFAPSYSAFSSFAFIPPAADFYRKEDSSTRA